MTEIPVAPEATMMTGTTRDGEQHVQWLSVEPHLLGTPELVAKIKTHLFLLRTRDELIPVTPTGPWVEPDESSQEAVFAAGNAVTNYGIDWENGVDVSYGAPPGAIF